jgi:lactate dehydrogenase-like 2-hydroxyacid dehydrogenase
VGAVVTYHTIGHLTLNNTRALSLSRSFAVGLYQETVVETTFALLFAMARRIVEADKCVLRLLLLF